MFLTQLVIAAIQIVALFKVPKIAENILNFSLAPVVGIGGELISASAGIVKMIASTASPAVGAALAAAGAAAGTAGSAASGAIKGTIGPDRLAKMRATTSSLTGGRFGGGSPPSGSGSGMGPIGSASVAAKESVKDSFADFQKSKGTEEAATKPSRLKQGLGGLMDAGKKVAGEVGGMALDATTGNYSGAEQRLSTNMANVGKAAVGQVNALSSGLNANKDAIESRVRGGTSKVFSRFQPASKEDRMNAQSGIMENMVTKELAGDDATKLSEYSAKIKNNEQLTEEDMAFAGSMQNVNLDAKQKATIAQGLKRQYDDAIKNKDYESMMKISNNSLADDQLQQRNKNNLAKDDQYKKEVKKNNDRIDKLKTAAIGNKNNQNSQSTINAQNELSQLVSSGMANKSVLTSGNQKDGKGPTIYDNVTKKFQSDKMKEIDDLIKKGEDKTSAENLELKNLVEDNKHFINDTEQLKSIMDSLKDTGYEADINSTTMDKSSEALAVTTSRQIVTGALDINGITFNFKKRKFQSGTFIDRDKKVKSISEVKQADINIMKKELSIYDAYVNKYNEQRAKDPSFTVEDYELRRVKEAQTGLRAMIEEIINSKKS